jgi:hypothetical protein
MHISSSIPDRLHEINSLYFCSNFARRMTSDDHDASFASKKIQIRDVPAASFCFEKKIQIHGIPAAPFFASRKIQICDVPVASFASKKIQSYE